MNESIYDTQTHLLRVCDVNGYAEELGMLHRGDQLLYFRGFVILMCFCGMFYLPASVKLKLV
jgi:hypothetical protein